MSTYSLHQLLAAYPTLLVIDTASTSIQVGWLTSTDAIWETQVGEAGTELFPLLERLLARVGRELADVRAWVFCDGPGSVLGIRIAATALRQWHVLYPEVPVYSYGSLELVAQALQLAGEPAPQVIADARRATWHLADASGGRPQRVAAALLPARVFMPEGFRHWSPLPPQLRETGYVLASLLPATAAVPLLRRCTEPEAFMHEDPAYATWTPQIHQAPPAVARP